MLQYKVSCSKKVKDLEILLEEELLELKNEIEETDMLYGNWSKPISSVLLPKNIKYYQEERSRTIAKMLDVSDAPQLKNQAQVMKKELETALKSDITDESLPLLLHQFFLERVQSLVQCKHLHLLRWRRFCQHTSAVERLYPEYCKRLESIDKEYQDAKDRAFRLSAAHTAFINKDKQPPTCVESGDIMIYLRWLITNLHSVRRSLSYMRILQWFPIIHRDNIDQSAAMEPKPSGNNEDMENIELHMPSESEYSSTSASHLLASQASKSHDKAFTGLISNELTQSIPLHTLDLSNFREQLEALAIEYGITIKSDLATSADEMELFGAVNRQFKRLFNLQEECMTFYPYDFVPEGNEHWGIDSPAHSLMKPCNWTCHITILPHKDGLQEKQIKKLKQSNNMDEVLKSHSRFLGVSDYNLVVESLKQHANAVQKPPLAKALKVTTHRQGALRTTDIWLQIYNNPELYKEFDGTDKDRLRGTGDSGSKGIGFTRNSGRRDSYDFSNTMQLLGLDESEDTANSDMNVVQGAYLSFLQLRILKLRDIKRQCLALFNYFRSVERTVTIYDGGLSQEDETLSQEQVAANAQKQSKGSAKLKRHASQNPQVNKVRGGRGKTRGFGSHHYISNTPLDFKIGENMFMEFSGVANHDDFYQMEEEDGEDDVENEKRMHITASVKKGHYVPHVQDQRGYYIMYELAMKDLKATEQDLLLVASCYINKDQDHRTHGTRSSRKRSNEATGEVDLSAHAHRDVDRFAVLLDAWTCELNFLHNKRELLDCYLESYHNTFDPQERHGLAQAITDVIHLRPRYDFQQEYFIKIYRLECACLRLRTNLLKQVLNRQIEEGRQYVCCLPRDAKGFGLPFPIILKQPIAVNLPRPSLVHIHMFEFHPSLGATVSRLSEALRHTLCEVIQAHRPTSQVQAISIEKRVLELAIHEWDEMAEPGSSFSSQVQKEVFSGHYSDDPELIKDAVESLLAGQTEEVGTETKGEKRTRETKAWKTALDAILLQHRLQGAAWETEILSRIYKHTSEKMGYGECHLYLRLSQFEFASTKQKADPPPSSITKFIPEDSAADRYVLNHLLLAVQELDDNHLPKFSFHNKTSFMTILMEANVLANIRIALACQIAHRNSLITAVMQAVSCMQWNDPSPSSQSDKSDRKRSSLLPASDRQSTQSYSSAIGQGSNRSGPMSPGPGTARGQPAPQTYSSKLTFGFEGQKKMNEPFLSIQLEKMGPRDAMVNKFIKKKETAGMLLQRDGELQKVKRQLVADFCEEYSFRMGLHTTRTQIIACYSSILRLLDDFPTVRDTCFMLGRPNEKKRRLDDVEGMIPDPKTLHRRPRRVLSSNGTDLLNLWFIPHYTEVLFAFRNKDYVTQHKILTCWLEITSSFHDILQCLHAHARLGNSAQKSTNKNNGFVVAADWGGTEGVGAELAEIQKQLENLGQGTTPLTRDPFQVAEYLKLRKDVLFLEFDASVRQYIRQLFLETDNKSAYDAVTTGIHFAIPALSDTLQQSLFHFFLHVPEPLDADEETAQSLYPWLSYFSSHAFPTSNHRVGSKLLFTMIAASFEDSHGAFPLMYRMRWRDVENCMQVCLASLDDGERQQANGEILGTSMLYQDVLQGGVQQLQALRELPETAPKGLIAANPLGNAHHGESRPTSSVALNKIESADHDTKKDVEGVGGRRSSSVKPEDKSLTQPLSKMDQPISSYRLIKTYFLLCKQLDMLKEDWATKKLAVVKIDTPTLLHEAKRLYISELYLPVLQTISRDMGFVDYYSELISIEDSVMPPPNTPEIKVKARQVLKLLEAKECQMLQDIRHKVSQEMSLVLAERSREETALPTDLWRKSSIRETFTVNRPSIVEDFLHGLMSDYTEENGKITFRTDQLNKCVFSLASNVMKREKQNYEMYSTFYENILHHQHQLLYQKEQELRAVLSKCSTGLVGSQIQAQFQLADRSHELILEITALRAAITEMSEQNLNKEQAVRQEVQKEYQDLVQRLFEECFQMKSKLAQHHLSLHENVHLVISETRHESMEMLANLRNKNLNFATDERHKILQAKDAQLKKTEQEKSSLNITLSKLLALNHWRRSTSEARNRTIVQKLSQDLSRCKKDLQSLQMMSLQNKTLLEEQLQNARKALEMANQRLKKVYNRLEREQRAQNERLYREAKEETNRQQLAEAQKKNFDRIILDLDEKDKRLRAITAENEKSTKLTEVSNLKVKRKVKSIQYQLATDRTLKLEAFNRVDDLQAHIWDFQHTQVTTGGSVAPTMSRATSANTRRAKSAFGLRSLLNGAGPSSAIGISSPPYTPRTRTRPLSSMPAYAGTPYEDSQPSLLQRPKTSSARIKTKIAAALLSTTFDRTALQELSPEQK